MSETKEQILPVIPLWLKALIAEVKAKARKEKIQKEWSDRERTEWCGL